MRVLLIEDDAVYVRIVRYSLAHASGGPFEVEVVGSLSAARARLEQGGVSAALLDLGLPDAQGMEGVHALCSAFPTLPVVVLTAMDNEATGLESVQAGAQDYMVKGQVEKDLLSRAVRYAIERKRTVDTLRQLEKAVNTMQLGVSVTDTKGRIVFVNPAEADMHGHTVEEMLGKDARSLSPRGDWSPLGPEQLGQIKRWKRERIRHRRDGSTFPAQLMSDAVKDASGRPLGIVTTCEDISERRHAEQALRESEERYSLVAQGTNDGLWDWDLLTNRIYLSQRWKAILGFGEDELGDAPSEWLDRIHPEDRRRVEAKIAAHLEGRSPQLEDEHRMRHRDGTYRWVLNRGFAVKDARGKPYRMAGAQTDITDRRSVDPLTGLPNRALFLERLGEAFARGRRRQGYVFGVLFVDLDRFKAVNDTLGHQAGDEFLTAVARRLEVCVRPGDTVGRIGGDEFALLVDRVDEAEDAIRVAERILQELEEPILVGGQALVPSASIGIALSTSGYERPEDLLRDADTAMYRAKAEGRSRWEVFDEQMRARIEGRQRLLEDLRLGVERGEFKVHYEPIVCLESGALVGFEALVRWRSLLLPVDALSLAEEAGSIVRLGGWLLREAFLQAAAWWVRFGPQGAPCLSVNLAREQFHRPELAAEVSDLMKEAGLPRQALRLEIAEEAILGEREAVEASFARLQALGVGIWLDRFGAGHASLTALRRHPLRGLKVDSSLLSGIEKDSGFVGAIIRVAQAVGLTVGAVGIETERQREALRSLGCTEGQGACFGAPLDAAAAEALLARGPRVAPR